MGGTRRGGLQAAKKNKENNPTFYADMGRKGGQVTRPATRWFALNPGAAKVAGQKGGTNSRRPKILKELKG